MAIPCSFAEENRILDKPADMTTDQCESLPVASGTLNGVPVVISCWKLTQEELDHVNKTGRIWLFVCGRTMPPCLIMGTKPDFT